MYQRKSNYLEEPKKHSLEKVLLLAINKGLEISSNLAQINLNLPDEEVDQIDVDRNLSFRASRAYESISRILVVDDEPFNLQSMKFVLSLAMQRNEQDKAIIDCITDYASSGKEALEHIHIMKNKGLNYGLVITDCSMPGMDGY